jgi:sulfatase maturation enzyme AslB (radical SAM superfamily)
MSDQSKGKVLLENFSPSAYFKEKHGFEVDDDTFCIMPWSHISTTTNGDFRLCCRSTRLWDIQHIGVKDLWNHSKYKTVRNNLALGVKDSHCNACWKMEAKGITSLRQTQNFERIEEYSHLVNHWNKTYLVPWDIPIVEFKLSNLCNLKCRMCWPKDSTPWMQDWQHVEHIYQDSEKNYINEIIEKNNLDKKPIMNLFESNGQFIKDIEELLPTIREFEFAGGEPLMDPLHFNFIEKIPDPSKVILKYSTNLTNLEAKKGRNVVDIWKNYKAVRLTISIDGYDELNSYIRHGSDWTAIKDNIAYVKQELGDKLDYIKASTTITALNIEYLVETLDAISQDFDVKWHTSRCQWPDFLNANVLPVDRLQRAKEKLLAKIETVKEDTMMNINNRRHLFDAVAWIDESINKNMHEELYGKFLEFNKILDQRRKESLEKVHNGVL